MKTYWLFTILILTGFSLKSQNKQDYIWFLGADRSTDEGIQGLRMDFNNIPFDVEAKTNGLGYDNNNASICDNEGNLLFYTNGSAVANSNHEMMMNGDSLNSNSFFWDIWGGTTLEGYLGTQNITILSDPGNVDGFYILHKPRFVRPIVLSSYLKDLWYSYVDMSLDEGKGSVILKNEPYYTDSLMLSSYFTTMQHANGIDWWILQPKKDQNRYLRFLIDDEGIHRQGDQIIGPVFHWNASAAGTATFSPDGTKYAYFNRYDQLYLYDFDRETGLLSNLQQLDVTQDMETISFNSCEWSPSSRFLYIASGLNLHQIDTWEDNIEDGMRLIDVYDGTQNPFSNTFFLMALAPNCKIYMCSTSANNAYHVIHNPDGLGDDCDFVQNGMQLPYGAGFGCMPNHTRWRVDDDEKCDDSITSMFGELVYYTRPLEVYPNPVSDIINIQLPTDISTNGKLELFNMSGQLVLSYPVSNIDKKVHVNVNLPSGTYVLDFTPKNMTDRTIYSTKIIIQK